MTDHSEMLKDVRELAELDPPVETIKDCKRVTALLKLADIVEAYAKSQPELLAACKTCDREIEVLVCEHDDFRVMTEGAWTNLRAARHLIRLAIKHAPKAENDVVDEEALAKIKAEMVTDAIAQIESGDNDFVDLDEFKAEGGG